MTYRLDFSIFFRTFALNKPISMKKTLLLVVAILTGASAFAQKKPMNVYRRTDVEDDS